jgi:hypothetical protein
VIKYLGALIRKYGAVVHRITSEQLTSTLSSDRRAHSALRHQLFVQLTDSSAQYLANGKGNLGVFPYYFFEFLLMKD